MLFTFHLVLFILMNLHRSYYSSFIFIYLTQYRSSVLRSVHASSVTVYNLQFTFPIVNINFPYNSPDTPAQTHIVVTSGMIVTTAVPYPLPVRTTSPLGNSSRETSWTRGPLSPIKMDLPSPPNNKHLTNNKHPTNYRLLLSITNTRTTSNTTRTTSSHPTNSVQLLDKDQIRRCLWNPRKKRKLFRQKSRLTYNQIDHQMFRRTRDQRNHQWYKLI